MTALIAAAALAVGAVIGLAFYHVRVRAAIASADPEATGSGALAPTLARSRRRRERAESDAAAARLDLRRLRAVLDELETGIVVCDRGGEVVARNRAAAAFAAARHEEALVSRAVAELLERARAGKTGAQSVELATHPRRAYHVEAAPVVEAGEEPEPGAGAVLGTGAVLGAVACVYDITDQQRTDAVRRDFVANLSHEIKTPVGALSLLAEALGAESSGDDEALVSRIREEAQRVARTIDDLMVLSYVEGEAPLDEPVDVGAVVAGAVERISEAAGQRRVEVRAPDPAPSAPMRGSPVQLESAVFNLLDNAVKFSEPGGTVELEVARHDGGVTVSVRDRGIGIPRPEQDRIFERFYRVDKARSRLTGGTGLGLAIVRHAVLNHGGKLEVDSREGEGSTFTIHLPSPNDQ